MKKKEVIQKLLLIHNNFEKEGYSDAEYRANFVSEMLCALDEIITHEE